MITGRTLFTGTLRIRCPLWRHLALDGRLMRRPKRLRRPHLRLVRGLLALHVLHHQSIAPVAFGLIFSIYPGHPLLIGRSYLRTSFRICVLLLAHSLRPCDASLNQ